MEDVKVCRVCLITNVRMCNIQSFPCEKYFLSCTGISMLDNSKLPQYVCYECAALVRKCYTFREKCLKSISILFNIMESTGEISYQKIATIDRLELKLSSNLDFNKNAHGTTEFYYEWNQRVLEDIKNEPPSYNIDNVDKNYDHNEQSYEDESDEKYELETEVVKEEIRNDDIPDLVESSDEDQPLSVHKTNKEKQKKKTERKRSHKKKEIDLDLDIKQEMEGVEALKDLSDLLPILENVAPKRKQGRPRKNPPPAVDKEERPRRTQNTGGVAFEDINLEEYVNVVKLSLEEQIQEVNMRQTSSNYLNAAFQCNLCYRGFIDTNAWKHHLEKHDPKSGDVECPVCKFRFKTKRALQKHTPNHEKKYACKSCSYVSKTTTQAKQHQRWHKGVTYKCQYCKEVLTKWTSYLSHVRMKHPSEFICGICGYSFVSKLGLNMHRSMMHKDIAEKEEAGSLSEEGPFCADCDVKFISVEAYKRHLVTSVKHIQSLNYQNGCRVCGEVFNTSEEMRQHHRKEHAKKRPKNYGKKPTATSFPTKCEHCPAVLENARDYWVHFRRSHPDKNYPIKKDYICDVCGKSFRGNAFLVYHKRTHAEERSFSCVTCGKAFYNRANLQMHARTHSDLRPYGCSVCGKGFKCKGALDRHYRSHTGVKPYECEVCGKAFGQSNSRKLHVRTVHLKQPAPYLSRARQERRQRPARDHGLYHLDLQ